MAQHRRVTSASASSISWCWPMPGAARMIKIIAIFQRVLIYEQSVNHRRRPRPWPQIGAAATWLLAGKPLREVKKFWSSTMRRVGITNYRRHDNPHTYASHLVSSGLSLETVGRLLGHTTATTTRRSLILLMIRCERPRIGSDGRSLRSASFRWPRSGQQVAAMQR